ncbi:MAG: dihydroorotate dehydrogenase electron transfer subunit [Paludibacter sp.]|nr:dihydroorotate dehydrogenase electron transfer subunit [Paludibacter sp.]
MQKATSFILDLELTEKRSLNSQYVLMKFHDVNPLPPMKPGQFAQVRIDGSPTTYLRRPISINFVDVARNEVWILVQMVGDGTRALAKAQIGSKINMILPLGNSFSIPEPDERVLLIGGGVGVAPLLMLGKQLYDQQVPVTFLLGARSAGDLLELDLFSEYGTVYTTTEDGSAGEKGYVTQHSILNTDVFDRIYTCGPKPMMQAVAGYSKRHGIICEVSLENTMACGIGACLCCVEDTSEGHICVCKEGPVLNTNVLKW